MTARLTPGGARDVGLLTAGFARVAGRVTGTEPPAVFLTLGRNRPLFRGWLHFAGRLMRGGGLSRRESEVVIVRVGALAGSEYELTQHRRLGRRAGLSADELAALEDVPAGADLVGSSWSERERVLVAVTDELHATEDLDDAAFARFRDTFGPRTCLQVVMLAAHYRMLATTLRTFRVEPDRPVGRG